MNREIGGFIELGGMFYQTFLEKFHAVVQPKTYLEIGTLNGDTLKLATCTSISVDPQYNISSDVIGKKPICHFYQLPSDEFFREHSPQRIFGRTIDLAFLDGMHLFEFLLRDFMNVERHCRPESIVILHDCVPGDKHIAVRSPADPEREKSSHPGYWTGDVWKIIPALQQWRPDLRITVVDAPPTGLVIITNLDPDDTILKANYQRILNDYLNLDLGTYGVERLHRESRLVSTDRLMDIFDLAPFLNGASVEEMASRPYSPRFIYRSPLKLGAERGLNDPDVAVSICGPDQLRDLVRPAPAFHDDPDDARLFQNLGATTIPHSPAFVVEASQVRQVGYRHYLTQAGTLFNDEALVNATEEAGFLYRLSQQQDLLNEDTGLAPAGPIGVFTLDTRERPVEVLNGTVVSLCSFEPTNYGAFLFRVLPKLAGRQDILAKHRILAPLYNNAMRDLFQMAGISAERIVAHNTHVIYQYDRAIIPSLRNTHALLDAETLAFYADLRARYGTRNRARKLFVSRLGWSESFAATHRVMTNERQLAERLATIGFELIQPHAISLRQQVEAFSSAEIIVGASGSALFNVVFCHPGTRLIDIESEPHWIFSHLNLFGSCGLEYGIFEARAENKDWSVPHKSFSVNIDALMARIASF